MDGKQCSSCGAVKPRQEFMPRPANSDGLMGYCRPCAYLKQRKSRSRTGNAATRSYERTKHGFLVRKYRNMKSRVLGIQMRKAHLYVGLDLMPKSTFYSWALGCAEFHKLYAAWESSGFLRDLCPSVDRIDSSLGYTLDNVQWLTHSENSRKATIERWSA